jgi:hypothetical protein
MMRIVYIVATLLIPIILGLTPHERWGAARGLNTDSTIPKWFAVNVGMALAVLIVSSVVVIYKQRSRKSKLTDNNFVKQSGK